MQIWASLFKTSRSAAHKWMAVKESGAVAASFGDCLVEGQLVWALWERSLCRETDFYNEKEKGFTSPDLFSLPPPSSPNHSIGLCIRTSNQIRATWLQTHWVVRKMQIKDFKHTSQGHMTHVLANVRDFPPFPSAVWFAKSLLIRCFLTVSCWR